MASHVIAGGKPAKARARYMGWKTGEERSHAQKNLNEINLGFSEFRVLVFLNDLFFLVARLFWIDCDAEQGTGAMSLGRLRFEV